MDTTSDSDLPPPIHHHPPSTRHLTDIYINRRIRLKEKQNSQIPPFVTVIPETTPPFSDVYTRKFLKVNVIKAGNLDFARFYCYLNDPFQ